MSEQTIREALEKALAESGLPGAAAAAVTPTGETISLAVGHKGVADPAPLLPDQMFWIASMTKAITSLVALQLVAEGKLDLDAPVGPLVPELAEPQVLEGFGEDGQPRLRPAREPVTLRRLLSHTSGLGYDFASPDLIRWLGHAGQTTMGPTPPAGLPLLFEPGADWAYGFGIDFAGRMIEAVTKQDLGTVFAERVFKPLGMADTGFSLTDAQRARLAPMHARLPDGGLAPFPFGMPEPPFFQMGGGGLHSTAPDYLKFLEAVIGRGPQILPPAQMKLFTESQLTEPRPGVLKSAAKHLSNDFDAFPGQPTGWSLGFLVNLEPGPAGRAAGSLAWAGLSNCYYWADPKSGAAGVLMTQLLPFADPAALKLFEAFERAVYAD
ncbi:serine hydrolase domain-containing protein [Phenylobacterium soli]|uniref:1,4-butanediol diacrylate esterase n=1 Tax=Phenylobacterium soli TaxID=2170551 RepID=A0A328AII1_9CAUL|nr:serine hydrolase domain-containing protein [Phenylobacterium soli]RAK54429.1 1,4-butanediol diacrylate esterase [Phenylobacterium soli]